jgi:hypothetical protein
MRLPAGLCLVLSSPVVAAPQKEDLPPDAAGRLGTAVIPATEGPRLGEVNALLFLGDNTLFVGTNTGWTTWDLQKRQRRQARPVGGPTFAVVRDAARVLVGSARKVHAIEPVESAMAEPARSWDSGSDVVGVLAVDPGGSRAVFSDGDGKLTVLDPRTGKSTGIVELPSRPMAAALTANGRLLAAVTRDGGVRPYLLAPSGAIASLWLKRVARSDGAAVHFSPDGRLLAASAAGRVAVLESTTGRQLTGLERKFGEGDVRAFAFAPDGRTIATASAGPEAVVRLWAVEGGNELASFTGHRGDVNAVAFAPDGRTLASAGADQVIYLWKVPPVPPGWPTMTVAEAWDSLDSLDPILAYRAWGALLENRPQAVETIRTGFGGIAAEQAKIRRWISELDHDEFRTREAARRSLLKAGLRAAAALNDPGRKKMEAEGEERVRLVLDALEQQGLRIPESGLYGEPLRCVRGVRVLETIGGKEAGTVIEDAAKGPTDGRLTKEAKAALEVLPAR